MKLNAGNRHRSGVVAGLLFISAEIPEQQVRPTQAITDPRCDWFNAFADHGRNDKPHSQQIFGVTKGKCIYSVRKVCWVAETKATLCSSNVPISFAKSSSERLSRSTL